MQRLILTELNMTAKGMPFRVPETDVREEKSSGPRFFFFSDLHNKCEGAEGIRFLELLKKADPDVILCGGDILIAKPGYPTKIAVDFMERLACEYPVFCGTGNHEARLSFYPEQYGSMAEDLAAPLVEAGVRFLHNESETINVKGKKFKIFGLDIEKEFYKRLERKTLPLSALSNVLGEPDPEAFNILLAHNPLYYKTYLDWGAELTLCGHYHGGIGRLGRRGMMSPDLHVLPKEAYGLFTKDEKALYVTSGAGEHTLPIRLANPREVVSICF